MAATVFVVSLSATTVMGTEFVPVEDRGEFQVIVELPPGTSFEESVATTARVEREVLAIPEVTQVFSTVGVNGQVRASNLRVKTTKKEVRERGIDEIKAQVRTMLAEMPFVDGKVADPEFMQGAPYEPPINVFVRGDDLPTLQRVASEIQAKVRQLPGAVDVSSNLVSGQPEVVARINRSLAADLGFSVGSIASQLRGMVEGIVPTRLRETATASTTSASGWLRSIGTIPARCCETPLYSPGGAAVRTSDVVEFAPAVGPSNIDREQRRKQAKIGIDLAPGYALGDVTAEVEKVVASVSMPATFEWGFAGDVELMQESAAAMGLAMILAIAFIYIVLASQFESFLQPFIIMLSLPLALVGALLLLLATGKNLGHARHDWRGDADGSGHEERHPAGGLHEPAAPRRAAAEGRAAQGRPGPAAADRDDDGGDDPRDAAVGGRDRRRQRVPGADLDCHDRRADHVHAAHAGRGAGRVPAARRRRRPRQGVAAAADAGRVEDGGPRRRRADPAGADGRVPQRGVCICAAGTSTGLRRLSVRARVRSRSTARWRSRGRATRGSR